MMETMTDVSLEATPEPQVLGNALEWYSKLQRICRTIHLAKGALSVKRLNDRQAAILIREIERCVEHLGESTQGVDASGPSSWIPTSVRIDSQLSDLNVLCEELVAAVVSRPA
jgi:hypothetical protein